MTRLEGHNARSSSSVTVITSSSPGKAPWLVGVSPRSNDGGSAAYPAPPTLRHEPQEFFHSFSFPCLFALIHNFLAFAYMIFRYLSN